MSEGIEIMKPFILTKDFYTTYGKNRKIAKIKNSKASFERDLECLNIEYDSDSLKMLPEYEMKLLELKHNYHKIDDYTFDCEKEKILLKNSDKTELKLKLLEISYNHKKIDELEYNKEKNDILGKPWAVFKMSYDENIDNNNADIEIVYNKCFIDKLQKMGYTGNSEDDIVEAWLSQVFAENIRSGDFISDMVGL